MGSSTPPNQANGSGLQPPEEKLLEPMNLHDQSQFDELLRQRKICGWANKPEDIITWRGQIDTGTQYFFWIVPPSSPSTSEPASESSDKIYAGHISMSRLPDPFHSYASPPPDSLPDPVQHIMSLFVLPSHRTSGLGRRAMLEIESLARTPPYGGPEIKALTLSCLKGRYIDDDSSEEWRPFAEKVHAKMGLPMPDKGKSNEDWYKRMGFRVLGEKPSYETGEFGEDGEEILFVACGMRKELD